MEAEYDVMESVPQTVQHCYQRGTFHFAGWEFKDLISREEESATCILVCLKEIVNPHPAGAIYAYRTYKSGTRLNPLFPEHSKEYAAAWLMSHWYEHALEVCPCIREGDSDNNFREAFIQTVLDLQGVTECPSTQ